MISAKFNSFIELTFVLLFDRGSFLPETASMRGLSGGDWLCFKCGKICFLPGDKVKSF